MSHRPRCRLPRYMRLSGREPFARVFKEGRKTADAYMVVLARANGVCHARLGLAIARKPFRSNAARNRVKRIIRESFRHHQHALGGLDIVVIGRRDLATLSAVRLRAVLERHWRRAYAIHRRACNTLSTR